MIDNSDIYLIKKERFSQRGTRYSFFRLFLVSCLISFNLFSMELSGRDMSNYVFGTDTITHNSNYLIEDTIKQLQIEKNINILEEDKLAGGRLARWYYGWVIFKDYPWYKKIVGGGFDYLEMFGRKFGAVKYDYPHNPFISAFLYSGIIGGLAYIWFIILVFWYYIKYWKHHLYFFICFLTIFFFSFVSADTHFSVPIFTIFSIIPFLTKYLVDRKIINGSKGTPDI